MFPSELLVNLHPGAGSFNDTQNISEEMLWIGGEHPTKLQGSKMEEMRETKENISNVFLLSYFQGPLMLQFLQTQEDTHVDG